MGHGVKFFCIRGFAEELDELIYEGISNWFISFRSLFNVYAAHFSYLIVFFSTIVCGLLSYRHSVENGKKFTHFWFGAFIHGFLSERGFTADRYWHAQAPVMLFGKELPLHILFFYPSVIYISMIAVHRLKLNIYTEPAAVGLIAMIMEIPYRMISVKFLHITYHDTEPMYYHKVCGVPWVEIISSLAFAMSYVAVYHGVKFLLFGNLHRIWDNSSLHRRESFATILVGFVSPIAGFLHKILLFHFPNDIFNMNPMSCLFFFVAVCLSFVVCFAPKRLQHDVEKSHSRTFLYYQIIIYVACLVSLALIGKPQNEVSIGRHEPTGDCTMLICSRTPLGKRMKRKKYLCADEVAARKSFVYNFECLEEGPPCFHAIWYTICGSPIYNKPQFLLNILSFVILLCTIFYKTLFIDHKHLDATKRLIVRFRGEFGRMRNSGSQLEEEVGRPQEVTVGLVFIKNGTPQLPLKDTLTSVTTKFK